jgi:hypothetical protein
MVAVMEVYAREWPPPCCVCCILFVFHCATAASATSNCNFHDKKGNLLCSANRPEHFKPLIPSAYLHPNTALLSSF